MPNSHHSEAAESGDQPGKMRTWWHPLLAQMSDFVLSSGYSVQAEVAVGKMPLRVDILLIRREGGQLSEAHLQEVSALVPLLNQFTLIEFKGPTDSLERGDFAQLAGCAFLWHSQQSESISRRDITLIVLAPKINGALFEELQLFGCESKEHEPGIFSAIGLPFAAWLVETDVMARRGQAVLSLVSRVFLSDRGSIIDLLKQSGHGVLLQYMMQQIHQFDSLGEAFAMQHGSTENMKEVEEDLLTAILEDLPPERRVRGLSPEELAGALNAEDAARLRELLEKKRHDNN